MTSRLAVLCSGGGSNLQAILDHLDARGERRGAEVVLVASDRPDALALERGRMRKIATVAMDHAQRTTGMLAMLRQHGTETIVLAGYTRLVPHDVIAAYRGRVVNVHPALLPSFGGAGMYGRRVHQAVIAAGARISGATVHFVDEEYDRGPIIAQWPVPVFSDDTADVLARRVLEVEHEIFPPAVEAVASGLVALGDDGRVRGDWLTRAPAHFVLVATPDIAASRWDLGIHE
jgi:formyltetrahydrofolate-dependent phosphoribosylglycinamide formyltransferase